MVPERLPVLDSCLGSDERGVLLVRWRWWGLLWVVSVVMGMKSAATGRRGAGEKRTVSLAYFWPIRRVVDRAVVLNATFAKSKPIAAQELRRPVRYHNCAAFDAEERRKRRTAVVC